MTTPRLACLATTLATLISAAPASANVVASDGVTAHAPPGPRRVEGRIGMMLGGSDVGDADGFSIGVTGGVGYRIGATTLRATLDHYRVGDSEGEAIVRRGRGTRLGGAVRYAFASSVDPERARRGVGFELWGELGLGLEHVGWREGGVLDRPSAELAVGFELDGFGRLDERTRRRRHVGYFLAFRSLIAEGPAPDGATPVMCGGPCDKATRPSRTDVSMFFEVGLHWGR